MNYYERHLGDYARDTGHLSILEHGAYTLLLDRYYVTERGIPASQAHRIARARSKEERDAVDSVLSEFFTLVDGVWINTRAEEEIADAMVRIDAARNNGKAGGRPKKSKPTANPAETQPLTQQKPSGLCVGSEIETQQKALQAPGSRLQAPVSELSSSAAHTSPQGETASDAPLTVRNFDAMSPAARIAVPLRDLGVRVTSQSPELLGWVSEGFTAQQCIDAVGIARIRKPHPEPIPPGYLDTILRDPKHTNGASRKTRFELAMEALNHE